MRKILPGLISLGIVMLMACGQNELPTSPTLSVEDRGQLNILPLPISTVLSNGTLNIGSGISINTSALNSQVTQSCNRFLANLQELGYPKANSSSVPIQITVEGTEIAAINSASNEGYRLNIEEEGISISADNFLGVNHALTTLLQLAHTNRIDQQLPQLQIYDEPRFSWRGLMIDVSRHWIGKERIMQCIEGMALAKMNVLHLHLTDDQGFRIESKVFPDLHQQGSDGNFFTQNDMRDIIAFANARGIRVIPEFDMPGHATSWLVGYPDLGSSDQDYQIETNYGIYPNIMNPVAETTYAFLKAFFAEMSQLFTDEYVHVGADEVLPTHWAENEDVQQFMADNQLTNLAQVQSYFILKVQQILEDYDKKMIVWDEGLRQQIADKSPIIQSWRGNEYNINAAKMGIRSINSTGWYLDHKLGAAEYYSVDPLIDPNALDIEPDTNHWQIWQIDMELQGQKNEGYIFLFGEGSRRTGAVQMMGRTTSFSDATYKDGALEFAYNSSSGNLDADLNIEGKKMSGNLSVAIFDLPVTGTLIGADDMSGTVLPAFQKNEPLSESELDLIIGGEACIWTEWVNDDNILMKVWPNAAAIAEKLWSPAEHTNQTADLYRRLSGFSQLLIDAGIPYNQNLETLARELSGEVSQLDLLDFLSLLEEVKYYERWTYHPDQNSASPLDRVADLVYPESSSSKSFALLIDRVERDGLNPEITNQIKSYLDAWSPLYRSIEPVFAKAEKLKSIEVLALALSDLAKITNHVMDSGSLTNEELAYYGQLKANATRKIDGVLLAPAEHMIRLIDRYLLEL